MSSSFSVKPQKLRGCKTDFNSAYNSLVSYNNEMYDLLNNLNTYSGYANVRRRLRDTCNSSRDNAAILLKYLQALEQVADVYENTERRICDSASVEGVQWVESPLGNQYTGEDLLQEDFGWENLQEYWEFFWDMLEQLIIDMPEWLRMLLLTMPGMQSIGLLPYILENDYLRTAFCQAILGDFTEDSNVLGVALSVLIGCIPVVGLIADIRDLVADVYNLIDDGPETKEWVALGFSIVGIIPVLGDYLKHSDEVADILKHGDDFGDLVKHVDDFVSDASKKVDDLKKLWDEKVIKKIAEPIKKELKKPIPDKGVDFVKKVLNKNITDETTVGDLFKELGKEEFSEITDVPTDLEGWMEKIAEKFDADKAGKSYGFDEAFPGTARAMSGFCSALN